MHICVTQPITIIFKQFVEKKNCIANYSLLLFLLKQKCKLIERAKLEQKNKHCSLKFSK
jgi:hypothetical protein